MSLRGAMIAAAIAFAITFLIRLPASFAVHWLPAAVHCQDVAGTLWHGECARLDANNLHLQSVRWTVHPLQLLQATVLVDVSSDDAALGGQCQAALHTGGRISLHAVHAHIGDFSPWAPPGWGGSLHADLSRVDIRSGRVSAVEGLMQLGDVQHLAPALKLGDYRIDFAPAADSDDIRGQIRDQGGPLQVDAQLLVHTDGRYDLKGRINTRPQAPPDLTNLLNVMVPADPSGSRPIDFSGRL